jgi:hypothetical protein
VYVVGAVRESFESRSVDMGEYGKDFDNVYTRGELNRFKRSSESVRRRDGRVPRAFRWGDC